MNFKSLSWSVTGLALAISACGDEALPADDFEASDAAVVVSADASIYGSGGDASFGGIIGSLLDSGVLGSGPATVVDAGGATVFDAGSTLGSDAGAVDAGTVVSDASTTSDAASSMPDAGGIDLGGIDLGGIFGSGQPAADAGSPTTNPTGPNDAMCQGQWCIDVFDCWLFHPDKADCGFTACDFGTCK